MATTYTTHLGIKKIGTGLEAGTWGTSTNQNFDRVEAAITRSVEIDLLNMPTGSTDATADGVTEAQWVLVDAADSGDSEESGSEGRAFHVSVIGAMTGVGDLHIRADSASVYADRTYLITNNTTDGGSGLQALTLYGNASNTLSVPNGSSVLVSFMVTTDGNITAGANNLLAKPVIDDIVMNGSTSSIQMVGTGTLSVKANSATAFVVNDGVNDLVKVDTTTGTEVITLDAASGTTVNVSGANDQVCEIIVHPTSATALTITDGTVDALGIDHSANEVIVGETGESKDLRVWGDVILSDQASEITLKDNTAAALEIRNVNNDLIATIDTTTGTIRFDVAVPATVPDILVTGSDGYVNFGSTEGSGGAGVRLNSSTLELSNADGETWGEPFHSGVATGEGVYKEITGLALTTGSITTTAHGLSAVPRIITVSIECVTTDNGWAVGDELIIASQALPDGSGNHGITPWADGTNVGVVIGSSGFYTVNKSGFANEVAVNASWTGTIRCWK